MPLNTLRLNHQPSTHPNDRIVFIKPLPRPSTDQSSYQTADLLLRAIAAQCLPIMKSHYLSVTTLEEHEPNPEFIGRNFNNGEIIQLVLRSKNGSWLPTNFIQMVMMHELAHNVHMNHSRAFWRTRNGFAEEMKNLWAKGYTGDGLWGSGRLVGELGRVMGGTTVPSEELKNLPLCGGTFRSRGRKRKRKDTSGEEMTWKEKRDRRIEKKFGKNGQQLGEDEDRRLRLDLETKGPLGVKPRVAQSKRGRELRAAAALARFGTNKKETEVLDAVKKEDDTDDEEDTDYEDVDAGQDDAKDHHGNKILDSNGKGVIRICGEERENDENVKQEWEELELISVQQHNKHIDTETAVRAGRNTRVQSPGSDHKGAIASSSRSLFDIPQHPDLSPTQTGDLSKIHSQSMKSEEQPPPPPTMATLEPPTPTSNTPTSIPWVQSTASSTQVSCPICTTVNQRLNATCTMCAHLLDTKKDPRHWRCASEACASSEYTNAGDCGVCGVCGTRRS